MNDADRKMAMVLQKQFNMENKTEDPSKGLVYSDKKKKNKSQSNRDPTKSLVDPSWEVIDPTPDIHILFMAFNGRFFWNQLGSVTVAWSKRMTTCAGVTSFEYRGKVCKITLSEPLLKLRPRKDLVETLLHEMIHALLFLNNKDRHSRDGHGPEFHKHMYRINNEAGTNITVYHDFHDEVKLYQQHWWRCDGPCQKWRPYYGFVKRAMNRAPGPSDFWWQDHKYKCGGTYVKVKEPEKPKKSSEKSDKTKKPSQKPDKKIGKENKNKNMGDITKFISVTSPKTNNNINTINTISKQGSGSLGTKNRNGTVVLPTKTVKKDEIQGKTNSTQKGNILTINDFKSDLSKIDKFNNKNGNTKSKPLGNVFTINDIDSVNKNSFKKPESTNVSSNDTCPNIDYSTVRNKWLEKYDNKNKSKGDKSKEKKDGSKRKSVSNITNSPKKLKVETNPVEIPDIQNGINCPICNKKVSNEEINDHLDECLQKDTVNNADDSIEELKDNIIKVSCPVCKKSIDETLLNDHLDICITDSDDSASKPIKDKPSTSKIPDLIQCEICDTFISSEDHDVHMQDCLHKFYDDIEKKYNLGNTRSDFTNCLVCNTSIQRSELDGHLDTCMGTAFQGNMHEELDDKEEKNENDEDEVKKYNCPICLQLVEESVMNKHIDICLNDNNFDLND